MMNIWAAICMACYIAVICFGIEGIKKSKCPKWQMITLMVLSALYITLDVVMCFVRSDPVTSTWWMAVPTVIATILLGWCWL